MNSWMTARFSLRTFTTKLVISALYGSASSMPTRPRIRDKSPSLSLCNPAYCRTEGELNPETPSQQSRSTSPSPGHVQCQKLSTTRYYTDRLLAGLQKFLDSIPSVQPLQGLRYFHAGDIQAPARSPPQNFQLTTTIFLLQYRGQRQQV